MLARELLFTAISPPSDEAGSDAVVEKVPVMTDVEAGIVTFDAVLFDVTATGADVELLLVLALDFVSLLPLLFPITVLVATVSSYTSVNSE